MPPWDVEPGEKAARKRCRAGLGSGRGAPGCVPVPVAPGTATSPLPARCKSEQSCPQRREQGVTDIPRRGHPFLGGRGRNSDPRQSARCLPTAEVRAEATAARGDAAWKKAARRKPQTTKENTAELPRETQTLGKRLDGRECCNSGSSFLRAVWGWVISVLRPRSRKRDLEKGETADGEREKK